MAEEKTEAKSATRKSRKGLILAIAGALVLAVGGGGAYFVFAGKEEGDVAGGKTADKKADKKKGDKKKAEAAPRLPAQFVEMDPPFVVNFQPGSQARFLQVTVQLMSRDLELVKLIEHLKPIVRNDLLMLFGNKQVAEVSTPEGKEALRAATLEAVRKIVKSEGGKPEALEAVYFTSFVMQ